MIRIGIVGYKGRMNSLLIKIIMSSADFELSGVLVRSDDETKENFKTYKNIKTLAADSDAIIDFTHPKNTIVIAKEMIGEHSILVCGTTGFTEEQMNELKALASELVIIYSANMSIGINNVQKIISMLAQNLPTDFESGIVDIHHKHKIDSPSGTALTLAKEIEKTKGTAFKVPISSLRLAEEKGEHQVIFSSRNESIIITHRAFNREIFAQGALNACVWGQNKQAGFYSMQDVIC